MSIQIECHGESHVGLHRPSNEDQFLIADLNKSMRVHQTSLGLNHQTRLFGGSQGKLLLVADGLGGHESGERASTLAVDGITQYILNTMDWIFRLDDDLEDRFESGLCQAFYHSQQTLQNEANCIPQRQGMGTTLTIAYIDWPKFYVVHVGDTRCYHIRQNQIKRITTDHSIAELVRATSQEKASEILSSDIKPPAKTMSHTLYNVIGGSNSSLEPEISRSSLEVGDALLLCSDGLTRYLSDEEILHAINSDKRSTAGVCKYFVDEANKRGGRDNITVVLARFRKNNATELETVCAENESNLDSQADTSKYVPVTS